MPAALKVKFQHDAAELWQGYQASTCAVERRRFQMLALLAEGRPRAEVLAITRYSVPSYVDLVHRYNDCGLEGLQDRRHRNSGAYSSQCATRFRSNAPPKYGGIRHPSTRSRAEVILGVRA